MKWIIMQFENFIVDNNLSICHTVINKASVIYLWVIGWGLGSPVPHRLNVAGHQTVLGGVLLRCTLWSARQKQNYHQHLVLTGSAMPSLIPGT